MQEAEDFIEENSDFPKDEKYWTYCQIIDQNRTYEIDRYKNYEID